LSVGDVFIPGGDLGKKASDRWADFNAAPGAFDVLPFDVLRQSVKLVVSAVNATS
jgi:enoyl-CoA hydratase